VPTQPDTRADETLCQRIANDLRTSIQCGDYLPGHRVPSGRTLMRKYGVARQTVQNAFDLLRGEGLIVTRPGAGAFVRDKPSVVRLARNRLERSARTRGHGPFATDALTNGFTPHVTVTTRTEPADEYSADALGLEPGAAVFVRERVMHADGEPVQLATSRLPQKLAESSDIDRTDTGPGGIYARLEEAGHVLDHFVEYVSTRPARPVEAANLMLASGAPVLCVTRIAFDRTGTAIEVNDMILAGARYELVYEIPAE
jgi:GntR family transcriptional regulator